MFTNGVTVIGLGYIGLPTSAALAASGVRVRGVDLNQTYVDEINAGRVPIVEPDLDTIVSRAVASGLLSASTSVQPADVYLIAVPTPFGEGHQPDLSYVESATKSIAPSLKRGDLVILESTSPPMTTRRLSQQLSELRPDLKFPHACPSDPDVHVAHCPERVLPGKIMQEIIANDRVIGGVTPACAECAAAVYRTFCSGQLFLTDSTAAEMTKLAENSFRDVNIAFANELANVCEHLDVDVWEVIKMANHHPRVNILNPGPGVGGHCIAVDPWFIVSSAPEQSRLIATARSVNDDRPVQILEKIRAASAGFLQPKIACFGLAFKPNVDDLRQSPAMEIVNLVHEEIPECEILAVEPFISALPARLSGMSRVRLVSTEEALHDADIVALLVDHDAFLAIDRDHLAGKCLIDTRGRWRANA